MAEINSIGKYEIRREIGRGAMGVVYEGYDPSIKRVVALKTIRADQLAGGDPAAVIARFRREAQAAGRLNHRDIKPANIFLLADGSVKVADFGIAHIESSNLTQVGTVMGTPSYMSPEQIMGLPVDGRSDLFSAGVVLYQFLTGERPFAGSATTTMQKVLKEEPLPPSTLNVQLPPAMDAVVRKALAKRADERFQTAQEFADAIRAAAPATVTPAVAATPVGHSDPTLITTAD